MIYNRQASLDLPDIPDLIPLPLTLSAFICYNNTEVQK